MTIIIKLEKIVRDICESIFSDDTESSVQLKDDGSVVTNTDTALQEALINKITEQWPYPVLAEEMTTKEQSEALNDNKILWIIDPLDGTTNFATGIPYYAVSIALMEDGKITLGLVYDPCRKECFTAIKNEGSRLNQIPISIVDKKTTSLNEAVANIDFKRLPVELSTNIVTKQPFRSIRSEGSVALDFCWLAINRFQVYLHGGSRLWDYAAGQLIAEEAGCNIHTVNSQATHISLDPIFFAATHYSADIDILKIIDMSTKQ